MRTEVEAGLAEGECEGWEEGSQAKTSPGQVGKRISGPDWGGAA